MAGLRKCQDRQKSDRIFAQHASKADDLAIVSGWQRK